MGDFDTTFTKAIKNVLKVRLKRNLTKSELKAFTIRRSGIAYELIMDYISDEQKTKEEIEKYVDSVIAKIE